MQRIEAIIKPFKLEDAKEALARIQIEGITVTEVKGYGRQKGHTELYRGAEYSVDLLPKIKLDLVVEDDRLEEVLDVLIDSCKTGRIGDGKLFVTGVSDAVRIRTGDRGAAAI
jgi:nitrogen regulatory protein P-II 1